MKPIIMIALLVLVSTALVGCAKSSSSDTEKPDVIVPGGTVNPMVGLGFDVFYDPQVDGVVPGYKVLQVGISNRSFNVIQFDDIHDRWRLTDRRGSPHDAVLNLRNKDPNVWAKLPVKLKKIIQYPLLLQAGGTVTLNLLFKDSTNLSEFKSVRFESVSLNQNLVIVPREG